MKLIKRNTEYKFINWGDVNHLSWLKVPANLPIAQSAFWLYSEKCNSSIPTLDKTFCDHLGKKCNGRNPIDKAVAIEAVKLFSCLTHAQLKPIRGKYGYDNRDILRAVTGRPKKGKASVGSKAVQIAQVAVILNMLRVAAKQSQKAVQYEGGKLSTIDDSKEFKALSKTVMAEAKTLNDRLENLIINEAIRLNTRFDNGTLNGKGKPCKKPAPSTITKTDAKTA